MAWAMANLWRVLGRASWYGFTLRLRGGVGRGGPARNTAPHRRRLDRAPRPLRTPEGLARPGPTRPAGGDPRQPACPIVEAEREGWLGEVEGLQVSLAGANDKLAQLDRRARYPTTVDLGMPVFAENR